MPFSIHSRFVQLCAALFACITFSPQSHAALLYEIDFDLPTYIASPNTQLEIAILLRETATGGDTARLQAGGQDGLTSAGFELDYGPNNDVAINEVRFDPIFLFPGSFTGAVVDAPAQLASVFSEVEDIDFGIDGIDRGNGVFEVRIASILFDIGPTEGEVVLALNDLTIGFGDTIFADNFSPDEQGTLAFGGSRILVTTVPEPAGFAMSTLVRNSSTISEDRSAKAAGVITTGLTLDNSR